MEIGWLVSLLFRWMHILAAITAVGGTIFVRAVVVPSLDALPPEERNSLHAAMRARWSTIVAGAILCLLISGLYNVALITIEYRLPAWYHPVFAVKVLAAFVIFMVASLLTGKTPASDRVRKNARFWLNSNIALAVVVVCLSGILRTAEKVPKTAASAEATGILASP